MSTDRSLLPLIFATVLSIIGLGMIVPGLPFQVTALGGEAGAAPLIFSAFSAAAVVATPVWGWLSDRFGRKPILLASAALTLISYLWLAEAGTLFEVYASRIMAGLSAGWFAVSAAYVADVTSVSDRAKGMGLLGASFGLGFTIGPAMGGWVVGGVDPNYSLPAVGAAICLGLCLVITVGFVKEPVRHRSEEMVRFATKVLRNPDISMLLLLHFTVHLVFTAVEGVFAIWAMHEFGLGAREVGYYLAFAGVISVIVQGGVVRRIVPILGESVVVALAAGSLMLTMLTILLVDVPMMILLPMGLLAMAMGLHGPAMQSLLSQVAPEDMKGGTLGNAQSSQSLARVLGPAWGAAAFSAYGPDSPFLIGFTILIGAFIFALILVRRFPKTATA